MTKNIQKLDILYYQHFNSGAFRIVHRVKGKNQILDLPNPGDGILEILLSKKASEIPKTEDIKRYI